MTDNALTDLVARLATLHRGGTRLALLFDYDGTLTPIVEHPSQARLQDATRAALQRLAIRPGIRVGIISGRDLGNLRSMVGMSELYYAGSGGLEMDLRGIRWVHPQACKYRQPLATMARRLAALADPYAGAWIEDKPFGLTLHYRKVMRRDHDDVRRQCFELVTALGNFFRILEGPMALEILPAVSWDKGSAVRAILDGIGPPVLPLYAGDADNDRDALAATVALGGIAISIGPAAPAHGPYRLEDPIALTMFLHDLDYALAGPAGTGERHAVAHGQSSRAAGAVVSHVTMSGHAKSS
jgi:trehalose 6-phosphate phosphatase